MNFILIFISPKMLPLLVFADAYSENHPQYCGKEERLTIGLAVALHWTAQKANGTNRGASTNVLKKFLFVGCETKENFIFVIGD
ncbi:MAG TPA: hypothetical protein VE978_21120 [Chitinophagales bacterium]|nr:hypothetical protein [Chitinophagales bacterium]